MGIDTFMQKNKESYTAFRQDLHAHPETAFEELRTAKLVAEKLMSFGLDVTTNVGQTGVVATYQNGEGPAIGLRADMDALDMQEKNEFDHKSRHANKMHGCGHDGHTTMLLAAAQYIAEEKSIKGTIHFIFQPAEENGEGGAVAMIEDGLFKRFPMGAIYGMHNFPGIEVGKFEVKKGPFMAAFETFDITINGVGGHGALPHFSKDPIVAAGHIITALQSIVSRNIDPMKNAVISITQINGGTNYNVIPDSVKISGSMRYFDIQIQHLLKERVEMICNGIALGHDLDIQVLFDAKYPPLINRHEETEQSVQVLNNMVGADNVDSDANPILGSEDFAFYLQQIPGCYILIGNGKEGKGGCMVHNPHYDFNDDIIPLGASYWVRLCEEFG